MIVSADAVTPFVNHVLSATRASKVDVIGQSQGGAPAPITRSTGL